MSCFVVEISGGREYKAEKDEFYRQGSARLEELDDRELYSAHSGMIRKSQVEPRILFEILVKCLLLVGFKLLFSEILRRLAF